MNRLLLAIQAFLKAFKAPQEAEIFLKALPQQKVEISKQQETNRSHLQLLGLLQESGRLVDFLQEDISGFEDEQIGAIVRSIHEGCKKTIEEYVTIRPVMDQAEGAKVNIPVGYDASQIKIVGKVTGSPPYKGIINHRGWKAHKHSLPIKGGDLNNEIIAPAEVEVQNPE